VTSGPRPGFRPRFLVEAALVGLLLSPLMAVGPWPTTELEVTRYLLILILYGWLGRRIARRAGTPGEAAGAGALAGAVAGLIASALQLGLMDPSVARTVRDLVPEALVPAVLGAAVAQAALVGAIFGAIACAVGSLVFRSVDSDTNLRRLFIVLLWIRGTVHADPHEAMSSLSLANAIEGYDAEKAPVRRRTTREVLGWTLLAILFGIAIAALVYVLAASSS